MLIVVIINAAQSTHYTYLIKPVALDIIHTTPYCTVHNNYHTVDVILLNDRLPYFYYYNYIDTSSEPALPHAVLLQDATGYKQTKSLFGYYSFSNKHILRGTLLLKLSQEEVRELKQYRSGNMPSSFNFKVLEEPSTKVYCNAHPLNYKQKELLLGIQSVADRFDAVDKLEWAEKLVEGSNVYVSIPNHPVVAKGIVRYVGKLPTENGIKFGVELLVCRSQIYFIRA